MEWQVVVDGKRLRRGYTTGSCAAAAARAAARMLFTQTPVEAITIETPRGLELMLPVDNAEFNSYYAVCSIRKDGGDDPDVTSGLDIFARVEPGSSSVEIFGGEGVGRVTLPGLPVEVGKPAINPVPRCMIEREVRKELAPGQGARVTVFVPGGKEVAAQTFNPRLGIVGGISILGTTGIVEPMSEEGLRESLVLGVKLLAARGEWRAVLVPGRYGESFAVEKLGLPASLVVIASNYIGSMLDACLEQGIRSVLIAGHLGKLVKVAGGIFHTHSRTADARREILAAFAARRGAAADTVARILNCPTTEAALDIIGEDVIAAVCGDLAARVSERCRQRVGGMIKIGTVLYSWKRGLLAVDEAGEKLLEEFNGQ